MRLATIMLFVGGLLGFSGCSAVIIDYDPEHNFRPYKTYRWSNKEVHPGDALAADPLTKKRIVKAVDAVLQEKGFVLTESQACDFRVFVHGTVSERIQIHDTGGMIYPHGGLGWSGRVTHVTTYDEGTVFIDIVDTTTSELVWRGWLSRAVRRYKNPKKAEAAADRMVREIMEAFPPVE